MCLYSKDALQSCVICTSNCLQSVLHSPRGIMHFQWHFACSTFTDSLSCWHWLFAQKCLLLTAGLQTTESHWDFEEMNLLKAFSVKSLTGHGRGNMNDTLGKKKAYRNIPQRLTGRSISKIEPETPARKHVVLLTNASIYSQIVYSSQTL